MLIHHLSTQEIYWKVVTFINFSQQVDKKAIFLLFGCYCINPRLILDEKYATNANDYPENWMKFIELVEEFHPAIDFLCHNDEDEEDEDLNKAFG